MLKRILAASLAAFMIFAVGCSDEGAEFENLSNYETNSNEETKTESKPEETKKEDAAELFVNPLTGVKELKSEEQTKQRPVAIMVNNAVLGTSDLSVQRVQAGLADADVIYESLGEGGLTRLLAVYQDLSGIDKIGTVRSARYHFIDFAMGHNAVYIHAGFNIYCESHLRDVDDIDFLTSNASASRESNGFPKNSEHNVYTTASLLKDRLSKEFNMNAKNNSTWLNFAGENKKVSLSGGSAKNVSVKFSSVATTKFTYDEKSGLYTRYLGSAPQTDYYTKKTTQVKNVFVLFTNTSYFADNKTPRVYLESGKGYYITNGSVQEIKWSKGSSSNKFKFTDLSGNELEVSAGNSWVCVANKNSCKTTIE